MYMNKIGAVKTPLFLTRASKNSPLQVGDELQNKYSKYRQNTCST